MLSVESGVWSRVGASGQSSGLNVALNVAGFADGGFAVGGDVADELARDGNVGGFDVGADFGVGANGDVAAGLDVAGELAINDYIGFAGEVALDYHAGANDGFGANNAKGVFVRFACHEFAPFYLVNSSEC
jgi:hypothetical protein